MELSSDELQVINAINYQPSVSVIISMEAIAGNETAKKYKFERLLEQVRHQLADIYPQTKWKPVFEELQKLFATVKTEKKSAAIYTSPILSKVFYLDIPVDDKIVVDESFEIRDLVYAKQEAFKYILLMISGRNARAFIAEPGHLLRLKLGVPDQLVSYKNDAPERVTNFSDPVKRKETIQNKFLNSLDHALTDLLQVYNLPVIIMGVERLCGHFMQITHNRQKIAMIIHGNYEESSSVDLLRLIKPYCEEFDQSRIKSMLAEISTAIDHNKLVYGMQSVWTAASQNLGRLLIVEKNFIYPSHFTYNRDFIAAGNGATSVFYMRDAVDDVIQKVINSGGEIRFVEQGMLKDFDRIALIKHY